MATRHEKVVLDLEDRFTGPVLRAAAAASLLDKNLSGVGKSSVKTTRDVDRMGSTMSGEFSKVEKDAMRATRSSSLLVDSIAMLGPAIVPLSAVAVPAVMGLSTQLGFAAGAAGVAVLAFNGVGDALKAVDTYQLEPTTANLEKMRQAMAKIGPAGREFVHELDHMKDLLKPLQETARAGLFPGLTAAMDSLTTRIPQVQRIINQIATTTGDLFADAGKSLAGGGWDDFFDFLEREASPQLQALGETLGNLAHTAANLFVAFEPMETSFSQGLVHATQDLQNWSEGLSRTQGFRDFVDYVQKSGPQVAEAVGKIANALVQVVQAAAPMGGPILKALGAFADVVAAIANSPIGTPLFAMAAGLAAVNRALVISATARDSLIGNMLLGRGGGASGITRTTRALGGFSATARTVGKDMNVMATSFATAGAKSERETRRIATSSARLKSNLSGIGKGAGVLAGLTVATSGVADGMGLTNTASLALMGTIAGPWGAAIGGGTGLIMDMAAASKRAAAEAQSWAQAATTAQLQVSKATLEAQKAAIQKRTPAADLVSVGAGYGAARQPLSTFGASDARKLAAINKELSLRAAREGAANMALLRDGMVGTASGLRTAAMTTDQFAASLAHLQRVISGDLSMIDFEQSIDDATKAMRENGKTLDINTDKGRANKRALIGIASSALSVAENLKGVDRVKFLDKARGSFIAAARQMGLTRKQAGHLADRLIGLDKIKPKPKVDLDKSRADAKRKQMLANLRDLDGKRPTPRATLEKRKFDAAMASARGRLGDFDGFVATAIAKVEIGAAMGALSAVTAGLNALDGTTAVSYTKTVKKNASGGWITGPGGPRDDKVPALLSNGEYVVNAAAARQHASELEWINAQGLRNGGYAGAAPSVSVGGSNNTFLVDLGDLGGMVRVQARQVSEDVMADAVDMAGARGRAGSGGWD